MSRRFEVIFRAFDEALPGKKWLAHQKRSSGKWESWMAGSKAHPLPSPKTCHAAIAEHMPEWLPVYERMVWLKGGGAEATQTISCWGGPPLFSGCSVLTLPAPKPAMVRSYDFTETFFDAVIARTRWTGRSVVAMTDGTGGGCLDGVNEDGLAVALTFGGRFAHGEGFAIPLIIRYVLETCAVVSDAVTMLSRLPCSGVHNVIVQDRSGASAVVYLRPDAPAGVSYESITTNHQETLANHSTNPSCSSDRKTRLIGLQDEDADTVAQQFLKPPLYHRSYSDWFGTLYTAVYRPTARSVSYIWPDDTWDQSIERFEEGVRRKSFIDISA